MFIKPSLITYKWNENYSDKYRPNYNWNYFITVTGIIWQVELKLKSKPHNLIVMNEIILIIKTSLALTTVKCLLGGRPASKQLGLQFLKTKGLRSRLKSTKVTCLCELSQVWSQVKVDWICSSRLEPWGRLGVILASSGVTFDSQAYTVSFMLFLSVHHQILWMILEIKYCLQ